MTDIEITAADRDLRSAIWRKLADALNKRYPHNTAEQTDREVDALIARHRLAARAAALEEAAKVAEKTHAPFTALAIRALTTNTQEDAR